jgi:hypothetical protein
MDQQERYQPATFVRTPGTVSMAVTTSTTSITPYTCYSLTSSILGPERTRSDRESAYHDFISLLSNSPIGTANTASSYRTAKTRVEVESSGSCVDTLIQHASIAHRTQDRSNRQIFVRGLRLNKSIVVNLEGMTMLDALLRHLQEVTRIDSNVIRLSYSGRKLSIFIENIPNNTTPIATIFPASSEIPGSIAQALTTRYSQFMVQSCVRVHRILLAAHHFGWNDMVLYNIAYHYWNEDCKICHAMCWKAVDDEVASQLKSPPRSLPHTESTKQSIQTRIKRTSFKSIFRYQGLDLYNNSS